MPERERETRKVAFKIVQKFNEIFYIYLQIHHSHNVSAMNFHVMMIFCENFLSSNFLMIFIDLSSAKQLNSQT